MDVNFVIRYTRGVSFVVQLRNDFDPYRNTNEKLPPISQIGGIKSWTCPFWEMENESRSAECNWQVSKRVSRRTIVNESEFESNSESSATFYCFSVSVKEKFEDHELGSSRCNKIEGDEGTIFMPVKLWIAKYSWEDTKLQVMVNSFLYYFTYLILIILIRALFYRYREKELIWL